MAIESCKNCGRTYNTEVLGTSSPFCCSGCRETYEEKKKRRYEEQRNKLKADRANKGAATAATGAAIAGVASAGAALGVAAVKGYAKLVKWIFIIGLPISLIMIAFFSIKEAASSKGAGGIAKTLEYVVPEPKLKTNVLYVDLIFTDETNEVIDEQVQLAKEQISKYKGIDEYEKFPKSRSFVQSQIKDYHTKFLNRFGSLDDITLIDGKTVNAGIAKINLKNNEWSNLDRVCELAKLIDADCILYAMPSSIGFTYANSAQGPYVEEKFVYGVTLVNPETQERQQENINFSGYHELDTLFSTDGASTGKSIREYFDFNEYYNYALSKQKSRIIENSGKWDLQTVKQSKVKYPNKKYPVCPYGTQKWKFIDGKKRKNLTNISSMDFAADKVIVTYEDGTTKEGEYKYTKANPTTTSIKIKSKEVEKFKDDYRLGQAEGTFVSSTPLYFYDAKIGELTVKVDGKNIISKAPVFNNSEDEFVVLLKYTKDSSGNAVFMYFEK